MGKMHKYMMFSILFFFILSIQYFGHTVSSSVAAPASSSSNTGNQIIPTEQLSASPISSTSLAIEPNGEINNKLPSESLLSSSILSSSSSSSVANSDDSLVSNTEIPTIFEPEDEWKEILPGQQIPGVSIY